ncbi:MAG: DNA (cytosine-5-)-methyltransferase, partial [Myxococcota bacterium]
RDLGYSVTWRVVDGAHFGPQHRERIIIVGFRRDLGVDFNFDVMPLPPKGAHTMREVLHRTDGREPRLEQDGDKFFDHANNCVNPKYTLSEHLWTYLQNYAKKHQAKGNGFGFGMVGPDSVSRTLSARYYKDGSESLVSQGAGAVPRRLTPRECARLQGFPDTFRIPVSDTRAYKQFGNSVVVHVIRHVAGLMAPHLSQAILAQESQQRDD